MPNTMAALPNIGGVLCWTPQSGWRPLLECRAVTLKIQENARLRRKVNFARGRIPSGGKSRKMYTYCTRLGPLSCLSVCPVCDVAVLWPNGWTDQDETWHAGRPWPWPHCVRWGPSYPSQRGTDPPIFGPCLLWRKGYMYQDTTWYGGRPRPRRYCVRWGSSSPPLKGHSPQFSANVRCGQMAGWTKMPLGMEATWPYVKLLWPHCYYYSSVYWPYKRERSRSSIANMEATWPN